MNRPPPSIVETCREMLKSLDDFRDACAALDAAARPVVPRTQTLRTGLDSWSGSSTVAAGLARTLSSRVRGIVAELSPEYLARRLASQAVQDAVVDKAITDAGITMRVKQIGLAGAEAPECLRQPVGYLPLRVDLVASGGPLGSGDISGSLFFGVRQSFPGKLRPDGSVEDGKDVGLALARSAVLGGDLAQIDSSGYLSNLLESALRSSLARAKTATKAQFGFTPTEAADGWRTTHDAGLSNSWSDIADVARLSFRLNSYGARYKSSGDVVQVEPVYGLPSTPDRFRADFSPQATRPDWADAVILVDLKQFGVIVSTEITRLMLSKELRGASTVFQGSLPDPRPGGAGRTVLTWIGTWPIRYQWCADFSVVSCYNWSCEFGKCNRWETLTQNAGVRSIGEFVVRQGTQQVGNQARQVPILAFEITTQTSPAAVQVIPFGVGGIPERLEVSMTTDVAQVCVKYAAA